MIAPLTREADAAFVESQRPLTEPSAYEPGLRICLPFRDVLVPWDTIRHRDEFAIDEPFIGWIKMPASDYRKGSKGRVRNRQSRPLQTTSAGFNFKKLQKVYELLCEIKLRSQNITLPLEIVDLVMRYAVGTCITGIPANVLLESPRLLTHWAGHNASFVEEETAKASDLLVRFWHFNVRSENQSTEERSRGNGGIVKRLAFQSLPLAPELVRGGLGALRIETKLSGAYYRRPQSLHRSPEPSNYSFVEIHVCNAGTFVDGGNLVNETFYAQEPDTERQLAHLSFRELGRLAKRHDTRAMTKKIVYAKYDLHRRQWLWERRLRDYYRNGPKPHECRPKTEPFIVSDLGCDRTVSMTIARTNHPEFWQALTPGCAIAVYVCTKELNNRENVIGCLALGTFGLYADLRYMADAASSDRCHP